MVHLDNVLWIFFCYFFNLISPCGRQIGFRYSSIIKISFGYTIYIRAQHKRTHMRTIRLQNYNKNLNYTNIRPFFCVFCPFICRIPSFSCFPPCCVAPFLFLSSAWRSPAKFASGYRDSGVPGYRFDKISPFSYFYLHMSFFLCTFAPAKVL